MSKVLCHGIVLTEEEMATLRNKINPCCCEGKKRFSLSECCYLASDVSTIFSFIEEKYPKLHLLEMDELSNSSFSEHSYMIAIVEPIDVDEVVVVELPDLTQLKNFVSDHLQGGNIKMYILDDTIQS